MSDKIYHFLCADNQVQVCAISAKNMVQEAQNIHKLSRVATAALGRQLLMTSMMGSRLKNDDDLVSTIIKGDNGYAGTMVCTGFRDSAVKGCVQDAEAELPPTPEGKLDVAGYVGRTGKLTVVRDMGHGDPYVGVCNLVSGEIAVDFAEYYTVSEQQPSIVYLGVRLDVNDGKVRSAGGMLVQPLPGCPDEVIDAMTQKADSISKLSFLLDQGEELLPIANKLLEEFKPEVVEEYSPVYRCDCSRERIERALVSVGKEELTDMIEKDHGAEVGCHFCNKKYQFTEEELKVILQAAISKESDGRSE